MVASWESSWVSEALLGSLWTQKRVKTMCFLMVLKRLFLVFEAPDGPLGLILFLLGQIWSQNLGTKMGTKSGEKRNQKIDLKLIMKKDKKCFGSIVVTFLF